MQTSTFYSKFGKTEWIAQAIERATAMSREHAMSKAAITRLFVGAIVAVGVGLVLAAAALWAVFASDLAVMVTLGVVGLLAIIAGAAAGVVSWIGALLNTAQLEDKTWFASLLVLGLFSAGLLAMVAYVLAGPDGTSRDTTPAGIAPAPTRRETEVQ